MRHAYGYESDNCLVAHVCHSGMVGLYRCLREVVAQSADHWQAGYLLTHSRNSLAKPMLAYSEQYTGILSLLKNHLAIICTNLLTTSLFHPGASSTCIV